MPTLNGMAATEFTGIKFGYSRRRTREKTQTSKEKAAEENLEKEESPIAQFSAKHGETKIFYVLTT